MRITTTVTTIEQAQAALAARRAAAGVVDHPQSRLSRYLHERLRDERSEPNRTTQDTILSLHEVREELGGERPATQHKEPIEEAPTIVEIVDEVVGRNQNTSLYVESVTMYSSLIAGMMKNGKAAAGRVWMILHGNYNAPVDQPGWASAETVKVCLRHHFGFSNRRIRQLLREGEGLFWTFDAKGQGRYWIAGVEKLMPALEMERLQDHRVVIPIADIVGKIKRAKAALFSVVHAGRGEAPISREVQRQITGISERTQREYIAENPDLITSRKEIAIGKQIRSSADIHENAFNNGNAAFVFTDHQGHIGRCGAEYAARQLPSSHHTQYAKAAKGRKRKINKRLKSDHVKKAARGNGWKRVEQTFFDNGAAAGNAVIQRHNTTCFMEIGRATRGVGMYTEIET